ncbi:MULTISPECIES: hypothetical protein [unclassified Pseudomonas]|uniref:hypothetical protein n=1 Tax=unclassified Pseudomonas TaxID=196821 RepID=UPI0015A2C998|nr:MULTISPECIES: hypothetical protein [unclassified Pseudomonas]NWC92978.1 hypothetical protein [Pseudomonas sp. IPO3779]NWD19396.1 hypothetical protein [Pseudomonas sp. IPO3778]
MQVIPVDNIPSKGANANWNKAVSKAVDNPPADNTFGPDMKRPEGDFRSAQQIIDDNPLLKNLGNQSGVKDKLKERVGDFEHDPDAAYRASKVLEHVEKLDENGQLITTRLSERNDAGNGKIDGFTKGGDARHGTEAGRLQDFGKYGWDSLKGNLPLTVPAPMSPPKGDAPSNHLPLPGEGRPMGDTRSAQQIIDDNPLLKNLGNQSGVKDKLRERVGDFEHDPDAAWRAAQVLNYVENYDETGKHIDGGSAGNGRIDGFTKDGEARHGTEAGRLQDFGKYGYDNLKGLDGNSADDQIKDLNAQATEAAVKAAGGDASKVGADYFVSGKSSASGADKVAAIIQLSTGLANFQAGADAFAHQGPDSDTSWSGEGKSPGQQREDFTKDVQSRIDKLSQDPDLQQFLNTQGTEQLQKGVAADPALKAEMERRLDASSSTDALESAFAAKDANGNPVSTTEALSNFIKHPDFYAQALGKKPDYKKALENAPQDIKDKVKAEYEHISSGKEINDLIASGVAPDKAVIQSGVNKAIFDAVLDDKTVQAGSATFNDATAKLGREDLLKGQTIDDFYRGLGVTGANDPRLEQVINDNIASFTVPGEAPPKTADIISGIRAVEDAMRGGAKFDDAIKKVESTWGGKLPSGVSAAYKAGVMHGVSGVLLAGAIGTRIANGKGGSTAQTVGQSFQAAGLFMEGGSKFVQDQFTRASQGDYKFDAPKYVKDVENVGKSLGGVAGNVLGLVTGALSAKNSAQSGDKVAAGFQGTFAGLNGLSAVAGAVEVATYVVPRITTVAAGVAEAAGVIGGAAGALAGAVGGVAAVGGLIYAIIADIKADNARQKQEADWYKGLTDQLGGFGLTPPPLDVIIAPKNGYIPVGNPSVNY